MLIHNLFVSMSLRKIIFLVIVGIIGIALIYTLWNLSQKNTVAKTNSVKTLSIWVVGDTSEQYQNLLANFGTFDKAYKKTLLDIRVFPDYEKYQRILLSTIAEGTGPDIFMVEGGGDDILKSKIIPIPENFINLTDFDKRYEDIFLPLILSEGEGEKMTRSLLGVPIGYETLGLFYHKSLLRTVPKTWSEVQKLYTETERSDVFPINIGLGPIYTPYMTDIVSYFMGKSGIRSTKDLSGGVGGVSEYLEYGSTPLTKVESETNEGEDSLPSQLQGEREKMDEGLLTTVDLFMRGRIAMIVGYPSLIRELEKAQKRAEDEVLDDLILTERLPQDSLGKERVNIARYRYLGISRKSANPEASAALISYIMSDEGLLRAQEYFPLLISPIRSGSESQKEVSLSQIFARTRLDAFIPDTKERLFVFEYGMKGEYERIWREYIDRNEKIDINKILVTLGNTIGCELESLLGGTLSDKCLKE